MFSVSSPLVAALTCLTALVSQVSSHTVITYPGWRGDNLLNSGDILQEKGLGAGANQTYPYGMQWIYPCGGMPISTNRSLWPVTGGSVGIQPGWFSGHSSAFFYINLGDGTTPENYSSPMLPVFQIKGPNNNLYNGSICLAQVPLPKGYNAVIGRNATIQVIETAQHGAALYNCADITFADPKDVPEVNKSNCENTTNIGFELVFSTISFSSGSRLPVSRSLPWHALVSLAALIMTVEFVS